MKKILSFIICLCVLLCLSACGNNDYIGIDKAKQTVVDDIGAAIDDVKFAINDLITDDNGDYYKIHFSKDGTEYVYEVDAMTGEILNKNSTSSTTSNENMMDNTDTTSQSMSMDKSDYLLDNNDSTSKNYKTDATTSL